MDTYSPSPVISSGEPAVFTGLPPIAAYQDIPTYMGFGVQVDPDFGLVPFSVQKAHGKGPCGCAYLEVTETDTPAGKVTEIDFYYTD